MFSRSIDCGATWSTPVAISGTHHVNQGGTIALDPRTGSGLRGLAAVHVAARVVLPERKRRDPDRPLARPRRELHGTRGRHRGRPLRPGHGDHPVPHEQLPAAGVDRFGRVLVAYSTRGVQQPDGDARVASDVGPLPVAPAGPVLDRRGRRDRDRQGRRRTADLDDADSGRSRRSRRGHQVMPSMLVTGVRVQIAWVDLPEDHTWGVYSRDAGERPVAREPGGSRRSGKSAPGRVFNSRISDADVTLAAPQRGRLGGPGRARRPPIVHGAPRLELPQRGARGRSRDDPAAPVQPAEPPALQAGQRRVLGRLHRPRRPAARAEAAAAVAAHARCRRPPTSSSRTTATCGRRPTATGRSTRHPPSSSLKPDEHVRRRCQPTCNCDLHTRERAGHAQPEHLRRARHAGALRGFAGQRQAARPDPAGLRRLRREQHYAPKTFRMSIAAQPTGGSASFRQFGRLTQLDVDDRPALVGLADGLRAIDRRRASGQGGGAGDSQRGRDRPAGSGASRARRSSTRTRRTRT